jgi:hypothetical protein
MSVAGTGGGHERRDVSIRGVLWATAGLALLIAVTFVAMYGADRYLGAREARRSPQASPLAATYGRTAPPHPRLQADPIGDLDALRAEESRLLESYGWIDRDRGTVRIPIARAMALLVARAGEPGAGSGSR